LDVVHDAQLPAAAAENQDSVDLSRFVHSPIGNTLKHFLCRSLFLLSCKKDDCQSVSEQSAMPYKMCSGYLYFAL
jgi:hypothetical protein